MQHLSGLSNTDLRRSITHIFLDEVHERDLRTDILLKLTKDLLTTNQYLKVVLMSATINTDLFTNYFGEFMNDVIQIPGRTFGVDVLYLDQIHDRIGFDSSTAAAKRIGYDGVNNKLLHDLILHIHSTTSTKETILVFLPGIASITYHSTKLGAMMEGVNIILLHSEIQEDQDKVFSKL